MKIMISTFGFGSNGSKPSTGVAWKQWQNQLIAIQRNKSTSRLIWIGSASTKTEQYYQFSSHIFVCGLLEMAAETNDASKKLLHEQICSLFQDLGISNPSTGLLAWFRVSKANTGMARPVTVKLNKLEIKAKILQNAKWSETSSKWSSLVITLDFT